MRSARQFAVNSFSGVFVDRPVIHRCAALVLWLGLESASALWSGAASAQSSATTAQPNAAAAQSNAASPPAAVNTVPGMPPVLNAANLYSEAGAGRISAATAGDLPRVYVPNLQSND